MSINLYDVTVPRYQQIIGALVGVIDKAIQHCEANTIEQSVLTSARLYPDMLPFKNQIVGVVHMSFGAIAVVEAGKSSPAAPDIEAFDTLPLLKAQLIDALAKLKALEPARINALENKEVVFSLPHVDLKFTGFGYLTSFAQPNFYFHATTAYAILRHKGVPIGKLDFLGQLQLKA